MSGQLLDDSSEESLVMSTTSSSIDESVSDINDNLQVSDMKFIISDDKTSSPKISLQLNLFFQKTDQKDNHTIELLVDIPRETIIKLYSKIK